MSQRAIFVVDREGVVRYARVYPRGTLPTPEEVLGELGKLAQPAR